jgi:diguanylate cyclase (GGDEF)-like protein/PAS domain S-box-containing protein
MQDVIESLVIFKDILGSCPVGIAVIDYTGQYITVNPAYCAIYGYTQSEMAGKNFLMVFPEEVRAEILGRHQAFLDQGGTLGGEWTVVRRDGKRICVFSESVPFSMGSDVPARLVYVLDITDRKAAEENMQIASTVYQTSHEAILVTDRENSIIAANPAFSRMSGYGLDEIRGKNPNIFKSDRHDQKFYEDMWRDIADKGIWIGEVWDRRKNGERYLKEMVISVVRDSSGNVFRYVAMFSDITARKKNEELIWRQANFDALTNLPNRNMFHDRLEQSVGNAHREGTKIALMLIDLDRFKEINDSFGHSVGDELLVEVSKRISGSMRDTDTTARLGGDEFVVIIPSLHQVSDVDRIAEKLLQNLLRPFQVQDEAIFVSASIGISVYPDDTECLETLFKYADQAMYVSKGTGRNRFSYYTPALQQASLNRMRLTSELRTALAEGEFEVFYQPIVDLTTGRVAKAEALVRWHHPSRGLIYPGEFIALAEDTGLITPLGDMIARQAVAQVGHWRAKYDSEFQVSINQSPVQIRNRDAGALDWMCDLDNRQVDGPAVIVEITEGLLLNAEPLVNQNLGCFRDVGVQIAIDDFGTGYSSLAYLRKFDIDYLKIDRSFVGDLEGSGLDLCEAIVVMAHRLGLKVVAEGVETTWQREVLQNMGCDFAQGFLFSPGLPVDEFDSQFMSVSAVI